MIYGNIKINHERKNLVDIFFKPGMYGTITNTGYYMNRSSCK